MTLKTLKAVQDHTFGVINMSIVAQLVGPVTGLLDKFIEDKDQKAMLAHKIATMSEEHHQDLMKAQIEVNKVEAASSNLFVSGWRPFIGWTCGLGMFGNFITIPFANFVLALVGMDIVIPLVPLETMMPVLMGMLGLGAMRSFEKTRK
jgi:hypothetical protein